jgi:hypothetical protein
MRRAWAKFFFFILLPQNFIRSNNVAMEHNNILTQIYQTQMQTITANYALKWLVDFAPEYRVTKCGKMFNTRTGRMLKRCYNGGSIGYWIRGKWWPLGKLRARLGLIDKLTKYPF